MASEAQRMPAAGALARLRDGAWPRSPGARLALEAGAAFALFLLLERLLHACALLPPDRYAAPSLAAGALHEPLAAGAAALLIAQAYWLRRERWSDFACGTPAGALCAVLAATIAFAFATMDYNWLLGRWHGAERLALVALAIGIAWRPAALPPFLWLAYVFAGQLHFPLLYSWTDKRVVFDVLVLADVALALGVATRRRDLLPLVAAALALVGMHYAKPGLAKLALEGWLGGDALERLLLGAHHQNGWAAALAPETLARIHAAIAALGPALRLSTVALEVGMLLVFFDRRLGVALLLGCAGLHMGILAASGIFFWKWVVLDIALALLLLRLPAAHARRLFGWRPGLLGAAAMLAGLLVYRGPVALAWYDTPLSYRFQIEAVGRSGAVYSIPPRDFAPYDLPFSQARFFFLTDEPRLVDALGTTRRRDVLAALEAAEGAADLDAVRARLGPVRRDERRSRDFERLLRRHLAFRARHPEPGAMQLPLRAPLHIGSRPDAPGAPPHYTGQEPLVAARVRLVEALQRGGRLQVVRERIVARVVPGDRAPAAGRSPAQAR